MSNPRECEDGTTSAVYSVSVGEHDDELSTTVVAHVDQLQPSPERLLEELRKAVRDVSQAVAGVAASLRDRYDTAA